MSSGVGMIRRGAPRIEPGQRLPPGLVARVWRQFARPYRRRLAVLFVVIALGSAFVVVPPILFGRIVDTISAPPPGAARLVTLLAVAAIGVAVVAALLSLAQRWLAAWIGEQVIFDLRCRLFDHVQRMPLAFFTRTQTGALISRMNNDVVGAQRALTGTFGTLTANVVQVAAAVAAMVALSWQLTVLVLSVLPVFVVLAKRVARVLQDLTRQKMAREADMNTIMTERLNVSGALLVKLFGNPTAESETFAGSARGVAEFGVRATVVGRAFYVTLALLGAVGTAVVYLVGGRLALGGGISPGDVVAFAALVTQAYTPLAALSNAPVEVLTALVSFDRVFEILDLAHPIADAPDAEDLVDPRGEIVFDDVTFRYPSPADSSVASLERGIAEVLDAASGEAVLRGVGFTVPAGHTVALVGPSGAGKTTLCYLVARLYDVTSGAVRIDGHDVRDLSLSSLQAAVGVVSQDPHLFHDTVRANLRYGRPEATDAELEQACRAAHIHEVIAAMPDGYDTVVGERGYRLSGGEKQRLAIARMLLKDPAIVLLDEATSHLDSESEAAVQQALRTALAGRSSLVIAHRLSTVADADLIVVLAEGRIVQRGTHAELLAAEGLYAELCRTQFQRAPA